MTARYRYRPDLTEVDVVVDEGDDPKTFAVTDKITGTMRVLTAAEFWSQFEAVPEPMEPSERLCRDCKHVEAPLPTRAYYSCVSPRVAVNLVDGKVKYGHRCDDARTQHGLCGMWGRCWEPKG